MAEIPLQEFTDRLDLSAAELGGYVGSALALCVGFVVLIVAIQQIVRIFKMGSGGDAPPGYYDGAEYHGAEISDAEAREHLD